ncbi:ABC transporter ATP-binding protein [Paenibacillus contaminans]|uniref:ABC transporter ATP-binding protein n=1 Tax=Paenibacillus contaminans TaxID=450362 RepID=UPI001EDF403A|nr:ABC transporter ATP-binding protein [Paenibacillus contaminans]
MADSPKNESSAAKPAGPGMGHPPGMPGGPGGGAARGMMPKVRAKNTSATLLRLWRYLGRQRAGLVGVALLTVLSSATAFLGPYLIGVSVDRYIVSRDEQGLLWLCMLLLGVYAFSAVMSWVQAFVMAGVSQRTVWEMRRDLFERLQKLPLRFFDSRTHGELMSRTTNDIENVTNVLNQSVTQMISSVLTLAGSLVVMLGLNIWLTLLSLATIPLVAVVTGRIAKHTRKHFTGQQQHLGELNGFIEETISGQKVIKAFRREKTSTETFQSINGKLRDAGTKAQIVSGLMGPVMNAFNNVGFALIAAVGGWMVLKDWTTIGVVVSFLNYSKQFGRPVNELANQFNMIQSAVAGAERVFEILDTETEYEAEEELRKPDKAKGEAAAAALPEAGGRKERDGDTRMRHRIEGEPASGTPITEAESNNVVEARKQHRIEDEVASETPHAEAQHHYEKEARKRHRIEGEVTFENVSFEYKEGVPVLRNVTLHAKKGDTIALVGPTGAGKTTVVNLLTRFYDIASGTVTIDGADIREMDKDNLRQQLGIVLQDAYLFSDTIRENIRYGKLDASDAEIEAAARLANADSFIRKLPNGYDTTLTAEGGNLSQGQRQLITIARAILADPAILILDEATSSIDTRTEMHIQEAMRTLMRGRTSFVIAHRLSTIREADAILVINGGEIIERGTHEQLLEQKGFYYELYTSQFKRVS